MSLASTSVLANPSNGSGRAVPSTLTGHSAAAYGTRLIVFGGGTFIGTAGQTSGGLVLLNDVTYIETNSTTGDLTWRRLMHADESFPTPRTRGSIAVGSDTMYLFGGMAQGGRILSDITALNLTTKVWSAVAETAVVSPTRGRLSPSTLALGSSFLLVFAGRTADTAAGLTNDLSVVDLRSTSGAVWHSATLLFTDAAQGAVGQQMLFPKPWDSAIAITPDQRLMLVSSGACMANSTDTSLSWKPWVSVYHSPNGSDIGTLVAAAVAAAGIGGSIVIPLNRTAMFSGCMGSATVYNSDLVPMDVVTGSVYPCPLRQWAHNAAVRILPDAKRILMNGGMGPVQTCSSSATGRACKVITLVSYIKGNKAPLPFARKGYAFYPALHHYKVLGVPSSNPLTIMYGGYSFEAPQPIPSKTANTTPDTATTLALTQVLETCDADSLLSEAQSLAFARCAVNQLSMVLAAVAAVSDSNTTADYYSDYSSPPPMPSPPPLPHFRSPAPPPSAHQPPPSPTSPTAPPNSPNHPHAPPPKPPSPPVTPGMPNVPPSNPWLPFTPPNPSPPRPSQPSPPPRVPSPPSKAPRLPAPPNFPSTDTGSTRRRLLDTPSPAAQTGRQGSSSFDDRVKSSEHSSDVLFHRKAPTDAKSESWHVQRRRLSSSPPVITGEAYAMLFQPADGSHLQSTTAGGWIPATDAPR
ncbi:MAG: hypothetical protein WDW36_004172 [Sanguina aurantia]